MIYNETNAYGWFSGVLKETGTNILPFDIYFEKDGQRISFNSKIQITITLPDGYEAHTKSNYNYSIIIAHGAFFLY
ncbi:MAG: hypothetical protein PHR14_07455 [Oscillospiraceae bacterium]|nr:hypothetical protein [Oscillospiraceae bacterium]